jgi:hypothetical protein
MSGPSGAAVAAPDEGRAGDGVRALPRWIAPRAGRGRGARAEELLREIHALRTAMREALEQYERRVSGQLAEVVRSLHQGGGDGLPDGKTLGVMLRALHATELKPQRGRAKDLVRIQELVAELTELATPKG